MRKLAVALLVLLVLGVFGERGYEWVRWQVYTPVATASQPVLVTIHPGMSADDLATMLTDKGLVRDRNAFLGYLRWQRVRGQGLELRAGGFQLDRSMSMAAIVERLRSGPTAQVMVRLQEGLTLAQMAAQAQAAGAGSATDYTAAAQAAGWPGYDFLAGRPAGAPPTLEGFLYPDTYQLVKGGPVKDLVRKQLDRFGAAFTPEMRRQVSQATPARPAQTMYSIVTLASIVEKEVDKDSDRATVCDIFYNRLGVGMPLGSDSTVLYGVGKQTGPLTQEDLDSDSPYNTRKLPGLPPGPISNPSQSAIKACVSPPDTEYLYFFTDPHDVAHFAATYDEFLRQQQQYGVAVQ
jgi:UPF0755 protein